MKALDPPGERLLDASQLLRIEGVHRGFLYQHLYAAGCLLLAPLADVKRIVVERDEDVEIVFEDRRLYVQVKTRSTPLTWSDVAGAMDRFNDLRDEHRSGKRSGSAAFVIAANVAPGSALRKRLEESDWPGDVSIQWPGQASNSTEKALLAPQADIAGVFARCAALAQSLPFARLSPETLVWKLAGTVMAAAAGNPPRRDHSFSAPELPALFEQIVVQLQEFPAPPAVYRSQSNEPALTSAARVRLVTGHSGAGKTSWVAQAAMHSASKVVYFDVRETPGPALASALARELAARLFGRTEGGLGNILLPGASGLEILRSLGTRLKSSGGDVTLVLDNAHLVPPADLQAVVGQGEGMKFLLLCQPGRNTSELGASLGIGAERLEGWSTDTIAQEVSAQQCRGDYAACQRLADVTGGMPLYVRNAIGIAAEEYDGAIDRLCDELEAKTHAVETAQELILTRVLEGLPAKTRDAFAALSLSDVPLERSEAEALLGNVLGVEPNGLAAMLRQLRSGGCIEVYGGNRIKVHDAMRLLGQTHLASLGDDVLMRTRRALGGIIQASLRQSWDLRKLALYLRLLVGLGEVKPLVDIGTDELFHEMGIWPEIRGFLERAARSETTPAEQRFWALDALVFADLRSGDFARAGERQEAMARLVAENDLGADERLALAMKHMHVLSTKGDGDGVLALVKEIREAMPQTAAHDRIVRYNAAHALFKLGRYKAAIEETFQLIQEYYGVLGIGPEDVIGRNADKIRPLFKKRADLADNLKHLADCLDLHACALQGSGHASALGRIHAMKFYQLANAPDSLIRVGQDVVDEFVARHDFIGAREVIEKNLLPNVLGLKLLGRIVPVRSQYAVVLAWCGDFDAAEAEMARLAPYEAGLNEEGRQELGSQRELIAEIRRQGPPPQLLLPELGRAPWPRPKIGRNAPCPCGSGQKHKKCHGRG